MKRHLTIVLEVGDTEPHACGDCPFSVVDYGSAWPDGEVATETGGHICTNPGFERNGQQPVLRDDNRLPECVGAEPPPLLALVAEAEQYIEGLHAETARDATTIDLLWRLTDALRMGRATLVSSILTDEQLMAEWRANEECDDCNAVKITRHGPYHCTRPAGHAGEHAASDGDDIVHRWQAAPGTDAGTLPRWRCACGWTGDEMTTTDCPQCGKGDRLYLRARFRPDDEAPGTDAGEGERS